MTRILTAILLVSLAITAVLGWQAKTKADRIALLTERNDRLNGLVGTLTSVNDGLAAQVQDMAEQHQQTLTVAAQAEKDKRRIAAELDRTHADLRKALATESEWADTPVPVPVANGVNAALERLRDTRAGRDYEL